MQFLCIGTRCLFCDAYLPSISDINTDFVTYNDDKCPSVLSAVEGSFNLFVKGHYASIYLLTNLG